MHRVSAIDPTESELKNLQSGFPIIALPNCNAPIKPHQNIPVISYLFLKGLCATCSHPISSRYPIIEAFTAIASAIVAWHFGDTPQTVLLCC